MDIRRKKIAASLIAVLSLLLVFLIWGIVTGKIFSLADLILGPKEKVVAQKNTLADFLKMDANGLLSTAEGLQMEKLIIDSKRLEKPKSAPDLPLNRAFPAVANIQDRVFVMGGSSEGVYGSSMVYRASLDRTDGKLSDFVSDDKKLPADFFGGGGAAVNNLIYYLGGQASSTALAPSTFSNKIYANLVNPAVDPKCGIDWTVAGDLPIYLSQMGVATRNEFVYVIGGISSEAAEVGSESALKLSKKVYFSPVTSGGYLNSWQETSSLPIPLYRSSLVVIANRIYLFGGGTTNDGTDNFFSEENISKSNLTSTDKVYYADINNDGSLSSWHEIGKLPQPRQSSLSFFANGYFYLISGYSLIGRENGVNKYRDLSDETIVGKMDPDTGTISSWSGSQGGAAPSFLNGGSISNGGSTILSGYLALVAGEEKSGNIKTQSKKVYLASLTKGNADNQVLASYKNTTVLPGARFSPDADSWNGRIYVSGGGSDANGYFGTNTLFIGKPADDGTISSWQTAALPGDYMIHQSVILNGYYYLIGGINKSIQKIPDLTYKEVYVAKIKDDGTLTEFQKTADLPQAKYQFSAVGFDSYIYAMGGTEGDKTAPKRVATVYFAKQNVDGTLSAWQETESLPTPVDRTEATVLGRYIYVAGGIIKYDATDPVGSTAEVYMSEINSDGTLKPFKKVVSLPERRTNLDLVSAGGGLMVFGGFNAFRAFTTNALYIPAERDGTLSNAGWQEIAFPPISYYSSGGAVRVTTSGGKSYLYLIAGYDYYKKLKNEFPLLDSVYFSPLDSNESGGSYSTIGHLSGTFSLANKQKIARLVWNIITNNPRSSIFIKSTRAQMSVPEEPAAEVKYSLSENGGPWGDWSARSTGNALDVSAEIKNLLFSVDLYSSIDRSKSPTVAAFALTRTEEETNGNANLNANQNFNVNQNSNINQNQNANGNGNLNLNHNANVNGNANANQNVNTNVNHNANANQNANVNHNNNVNSGGNGNKNANRNNNTNGGGGTGGGGNGDDIAGPYLGTTVNGVRSSGRLPGSGASFLLIFIISAIVVAIVFLYKEYIKK